MNRREFITFHETESLPVRLEELFSESAEKLRDLPLEDINQLVHDFKLQQDELSLRNEEIRILRERLKDSQSKYQELLNSIQIHKEGSGIKAEATARNYEIIIANEERKDDFSGHKQSPDSLTDILNFNDALLHNAPVPLLVNNQEGKIEYLNERFTATFGYLLEDFPNMETWWVRVCPDETYRQKIKEIWSRSSLVSSRRNIAIQSQECRITCKDNSIRIVEVSSTAIGNKGVVVFNDITQRRQAEEDLKQSIDKVQRALQSSIDAAAKMVEMRDPYTAGHQQKVAKLAIAIATEMGLPQDQVRYIGMAAIVHDIGKIYVPAEILSRTGKLTDLEFQMMKTHVQGSYDILKTIEFPWPIAKIALQHHERLDGSGYPQGLKGEEIMLEARILAVADTMEAMSAHRPYRAALGMGEALEEISKNKGRLYDNRIAEACINIFLEKGFRLDQE